MFGRFEPKRVQGILDGVGYTFPGRGGTEVSVIRHRGSYGGPQGLWEAAVFDPITGSTILEPKGWLTEEEVVTYLEETAL